MRKKLKIFPNKTILIEKALNLVLKKLNTALETKEKCAIALSGGSTPKPLYQALARQTLDWEKMHIFWGDERYVGADHPDSNQNMAGQAWLNHVPIPRENIHPMPTQSHDPALDAQKYEAELRQWFKVSEPEFPRFDMVLLGMGDDGHTASLFPHTEALTVRDRCITVGNKDGQPRLTFTAPLINHADCVIFLVAGVSKRPALAQIFAPDASALAYPSRLIQPQGELWWLLDQAAGAELLEVQP
jgi:6-phosphogluconolactonase